MLSQGRSIRKRGRRHCVPRSVVLPQYSEHTISFVLPLTMPMMPFKHGCSDLVPTPPPFQTIRILSVYIIPCPTSLSLVLMISHLLWSFASFRCPRFTSRNTAGI
ncbi:hypothetical protein EDD15DRAFT_1682475 [Pisolithus albus]|nr:hypothetical protein EDD15DRAFT_1682475 [Pisolithus albus]